MKYDFTISGNNTDSIVDTLNEYGICVIENFVSNVEDIKKESLLLIKKHNKQYEFGDFAILRGHNKIKKYKSINSLFNQQIMKEISSKYLKRKSNLNNEIYITHDYRNNKGTGRNGFLHFDRTYTFKFFIYLSDVDEGCGPFTVIPKTHLIGKKLRKKYNNNSYEKKKNRIFKDHPDLGYTEKDLVPIIGNSGTLIIFDTDLFHMGGKTEPNKERIIIRGHTR
jgi:ectoine hydroxylase-related dioxygenase (phytanoyl-CoA dioxygenase family)